jgi:iron complex outermembrane receptor protein
VVTVRKVAESQRDVPATITAVTATQLQETGPVDGTGDLLRTVAGVRFNDLQAPNLSEISIRGSGTERATGADSGVGLFVNGAYVGSSTLGGRNFRKARFTAATRNSARSTSFRPSRSLKTPAMSASRSPAASTRTS